MSAPSDFSPEPTSWPWAPSQHRIAGPGGSSTVLAVLALPDLPHARAVVVKHLPDMGAAVYAELGLLHPRLRPALLPLVFVRRPQAIAELTRLRDVLADPDHRVVEARGWGLRAAHDALAQWDDGPHAGAMFVTGTVPALTRAAALS